MSKRKKRSGAHAENARLRAALATIHNALWGTTDVTKREARNLARLIHRLSDDARGLSDLVFPVQRITLHPEMFDGLVQHLPEHPCDDPQGRVWVAGVEVRRGEPGR